MKNLLLETRSYIDKETGEELEVPVIVHLDDKNHQFEMVFFGHLLDVIEDLGNKKIKVLKHIIENRIVGKNVYIGTINDIASQLGFSNKTIQQALKILEERDAIKRKTGVIYINPTLIVDGRYKKKIMHEYRNVE